MNSSWFMIAVCSALMITITFPLGISGLINQGKEIRAGKGEILVCMMDHINVGYYRRFEVKYHLNHRRNGTDLSDIEEQQSQTIVKGKDGLMPDSFKVGQLFKCYGDPNERIVAWARSYYDATWWILTICSSILLVCYYYTLGLIIISQISTSKPIIQKSCENYSSTNSSSIPLVEISNV